MCFVVHQKLDLISLKIPYSVSKIAQWGVRINKKQAKIYSLLFCFCAALIFKATPREKTNEGC